MQLSAQTYIWSPNILDFMTIIITTVTIAIAVFIITIRIIAISCSGVPKPISGLPLSLTPTINYGGEAGYLFSQAYCCG